MGLSPAAATVDDDELLDEVEVSVDTESTALTEASVVVAVGEPASALAGTIARAAMAMQVMTVFRGRSSDMGILFQLGELLQRTTTSAYVKQK